MIYIVTILLVIFYDKEWAKTPVPRLLKLFLPHFPWTAYVMSWLWDLCFTTVNVPGVFDLYVLAIFFGHVW